MIKKGRYIAVRPNTLIESRYDLTSSQNDILDIVLSKIDDDNNYLYELNINDYKHLYKTDISNLYRDFKKAVKSMEGTGFYLISSNDKGIEKETFFAWFASIDYLEREGKIVVEVGQRLKGLLIEMKKRIYYKIEYPLNFNSIYSKRIYYYLKSFEDTRWRIDNLDTLRKKLQCPKSYDKYSFFRIKVLDMAQKEINNYSDISFAFEEIKTGRKVTGIKFIIHSDKTNSKDEIAATTDATLEDPQQDKYKLFKEVQQVKEIFEEDISDKEALSLLSMARENINLLRDKYGIAKQQGNIKNVVGFVIKAIKEDYKEPVGKDTANSFRDYSGQREIDIKQLEKEFLGRD